jgi:hypothetical protein
MEETKHKIVPKIIITTFLLLSIYEIIISLEYIFMVKNKNNFQNNILTFVIIRYFINILLCVYIYKIYIQKINEYKLGDIIFYPVVLIFNIFTINFFININNCGVFKIVIFIEFVLFTTISALILLILCLISFLYSIDMEIVFERPDNIAHIINNIPQTAAPVNNIALVNVQIPEAQPVNISIGTRI